MRIAKVAMNYEVVETDSITELRARVNQYATLGWIPQGGLEIARPTVSGPLFFYQAVFKPTGIPSPPLQIHRKRGRPKKNDSRNHASAIE